MTRSEWRQLVVVVLTVLLASTTFAQDKGEKKILSNNSAAAASLPSAGSGVVPKEYEIGAGDVLAINVWKEAELSRVLPVRPDGNLSLPLIGEVKASGATAAQLQATITEAFRKYLDNPEVTVMVQEARSQRFNVVGQVQRPGSFVLTQPTTVLDALALVGGFRDFANVKKIYVLRQLSDGTTQRLPFNYKRVIKGEKLEQNVALQPRDTIVVP